jgi:hypothetical protein
VAAEELEVYRKLAEPRVVKGPPPPEKPAETPSPPESQEKPKQEAKPPEPPKKEPIPLDLLERLAAACEGKLRPPADPNAPKPEAPDPILEQLALLLPPAPEGLMPKAMEEQMVKLHGKKWLAPRRAVGVDVAAPTSEQER